MTRYNLSNWAALIVPLSGKTPIRSLSDAFNCGSQVFVSVPAGYQISRQIDESLY